MFANQSAAPWNVTDFSPYDNESLSRDVDNSTGLHLDLPNTDFYSRIGYVTLAVVGIFDNLLVVLVIGLSKTMRKRHTNVLILNQSLIDLVASAFIVAAKLIKNKSVLSGFFDDVYCRLWITGLLQWSLFASSSYNLIAITVERYLGVVYPFVHLQSFERVTAYRMCVLAWVVGPAFYCAMMLPTSGLVDGRCRGLFFFASETWKTVTGVVAFVFQFVIPMVVFAVCYTRMINALRLSQKRRSAHAPTRSGDAAAGAAAAADNSPMSRAKRNTLKTLVSVLIAYIICNSPNQILFLFFNFGYRVSFSGVGYHLTVMGVYLNCCISPFIYTLQYEQFQSELRRHFRRYCCRAPKPVFGGDDVHVPDRQSTTSSLALSVIT